MAKVTVETRVDRVRLALERLRAERDRRLAESDWTQLPDSPLSPDKRRAWAAYRQALRDLPAHLTDEQVLAGDILWPEPPKL